MLRTILLPKVAYGFIFGQLSLFFFVQDWAIVPPHLPADINKISPRHPKDTAKISPSYAKDIQNISPTYPLHILMVFKI